MTDPAAAIAEALEATVAPLRIELDVLRDQVRDLRRELATVQPVKRLTYAEAAELLGVSVSAFRTWAAARGVNGLEACGAISGQPPRVDPVALVEWHAKRRTR